MMNTLSVYDINFNSDIIFFFFVAAIGLAIFFYSIFSKHLLAKKIFTVLYLYYHYLTSILIFGIHCFFNINVEREFYPDYLEHHEIEEISIRAQIISKTYTKIKPLAPSECLAPYTVLSNPFGTIVLKDINIRNN